MYGFGAKYFLIALRFSWTLDMDDSGRLISLTALSKCGTATFVGLA
jgi:hypothetical protein